MPTPWIPAVLAAFSMVRSRLRGSIGVPSSVVNTRPESVHWFPARSLSCFCVVRCLRSS